MHCATHIIGSMTDSWNMKRHYIEGIQHSNAFVPDLRCYVSALTVNLMLVCRSVPHAGMPRTYSRFCQNQVRAALLFLTCTLYIFACFVQGGAANRGSTRRGTHTHCLMLMLRLLQSACVGIMNDAARAGERNQLDGRGCDGKHCDTGAMA
jgi:hypothetical protein